MSAASRRRSGATLPLHWRCREIRNFGSLVEPRACPLPSELAPDSLVQTLFVWTHLGERLTEAVPRPQREREVRVHGRPATIETIWIIG